jgi:gliding motility-associated protein GldM|tara:strand:- start:863 stop:2557 length:1695 start_codon:yes stop_codon:yes gene_type:complete
MAGGNLSPRQKMINMMYLVLTALLALNVSKEVLNSFFEVNTGVVRTTNNFSSKNNETYNAFTAAAELNPVKAGPFRDQALSIKKEADALVDYIQELKYNLVLLADNEVFLGQYTDLEGEVIEGNRTELSWNDLSKEKKKLNIANLSNKENREASGELLVNSGKALELKGFINDYRTKLIETAGSNDVLKLNINSALSTSDKRLSGQSAKISWEVYNFEDMPSVGALTLLSKMQSDVRNTEADIIKLLRENIDAGSLKFTSAEAIQIPTSTFVLRGDSFRSQIFISAKDTTQDPTIYVGDYDSIGPGQYEMVGNFDTVKVINGKGMFSRRTSSAGLQNWGGLVAMKTETGTKTYPFKGSYLVANKTAVVSPVNMNILYLEVDNPLKISVPGFSAGDISASFNNGKLVPTKKNIGEYIARPNKKGKAQVTLYAKVDGKKSKMGSVEFRVKEVPPPKAKVQFASETGGTMMIDKMRMVNSGGVLAELKDFDFKGVRYVITSYRLTGMYKGEQMKEDTKGPAFNDKMINVIKNTKSGNTITISNIKAKRVDAKNTAVRALDPLVLEIK